MANIYLNELDRFAEDTLIPTYRKGKRRADNPEYTSIRTQLAAARRRADLAEVKRLTCARRKLMAVAPCDPDYRRLRYLRYADDFLLGFVGSRKEAEEIRQRLSEFLEQELKLTLSVEKTLITHATDDKAKFLGYEITVTRCASLISDNSRRTTNGNIALLMPRKVVAKYRHRYSRKGKIVHRTELTPETDYTIIQRYQAVLQGLYNFYCRAVNVGNKRRMTYLKWVLETSLTKTLARKFTCKVSDIYRRYAVTVLHRKILRVVVKRPDKEPLVATFGGISFERIPDGMGAVDFRFESTWHQPANPRSEVVQRLLVGQCELCGIEDGPVQVHHIRKLADIDRPGRRPKARWEKIMSARNPQGTRRHWWFARIVIG